MCHHLGIQLVYCTVNSKAKLNDISVRNFNPIITIIYVTKTLANSWTPSPMDDMFGFPAQNFVYFWIFVYQKSLQTIRVCNTLIRGVIETLYAQQGKQIDEPQVRNSQCFRNFSCCC